MAFDDGPQLGVHGDLGIEIDFLGPFPDVDDLAIAVHVPHQIPPDVQIVRCAITLP